MISDVIALSGVQFLQVIVRSFLFNLELICTSEFLKKLKLYEPLRRVQCKRFEKLTSAN